MEAYSFLARRVGPVLAEKIIFSGKIYTSPELHEMGIVDKVVKREEGREALYEYVSCNNRQFTSRRALYKVRRRYSPVDYQEMTDIMDIWVYAALELDVSSLRNDPGQKLGGKRLLSSYVAIGYSAAGEMLLVRVSTIPR